MARALEGEFDVVMPDARGHRKSSSRPRDIDTRITQAMSQELQDINQHLRIEQIQNAGHGIPYDQPELLVTVVKSYLHADVPS